MWTCPICKTTNETNNCRSCGFDKSKDYTNHRSLCTLSKSGSKIFKPAQPGDNILMASSDTDYVFGRKMDRTKITTIYFRNKKENIGEDAWDVSEKQNGSIMAWTEEKRDGFKDLYLAANGNILANKDCSMLFTGYENLKKFVGLQYFRTDQTEDMHGMFFDCRKLKSLNLKKMKTDKVTNMSDMFFSCWHLQSLNLENFHTANVTAMIAMFSWCLELKELDLSSFDTSNVKNMDKMFFHCKNLEKLNISSFNTSNVESMAEMFKQCESLGELDVSYFDTSKIENMPSFSEYTKLPDNVTLKSADNILMASTGTIVGRKIDREQIAAIYFQNKKENIGKDAWDVSKKQDGSIMAWTEQKEDGLLDLYIAANGNIIARNASFMFWGYRQLKNIFGLEFLQTDQITDMSYMFYDCKSLESLDLSYFDTSQVTNMSYMFCDCKSLESLDLSHFDTSQVTSMVFMFGGCESLESLDLSHFDTSQVTRMGFMFSCCTRLKSLNLSHFDTSQVTDMSSMFMGCNSLKSLDLSHFDTNQVTDMSWMFSGCNSLKSLDLSHFDTSQVTNMLSMFEACNSLKSLDLSHFDTSNVENLAEPLQKYLEVPQGVCLKIKEPELPGDNVLMASSDEDYVFGRKMDRSKIGTVHFLNSKGKGGEDAWDVSEKQNGSIMAWTEEKEDGLLDLYIAANGNIIANRDCSHLFSKYSMVKKIEGLEFLKTDQTENMEEMFGYCENLLDLDVSRFGTGQATKMGGMFDYCKSLESLDVSHFDTSQVTNMGYMFYCCWSLKSLDVSHFDTSRVTTMEHMFFYCVSLKSLDVSHFDTKQVISTSGMFSNCAKLKILDVSNFDTTRVKDFSVPAGVHLKMKKENGFFNKLWEKLSN